LLAWLRLGELKAEEIECHGFDRAKFLENLRAIRQLTVKPAEEFLPAIQTLCAEAGVAFAVVEHLRGMTPSGISRWLTPRKALIQQALRQEDSNYHFWLTFYQEAAHLLLHSKKAVFLDVKGYGSADPQEEAYEWAANFLVPQQAMHRFVAEFQRTSREVRSFAAEQGIAPGIVVGQLQKLGILKFYSQMNKLKERYDWDGG
jgi:hypothetical protein